MKRKNWVCSRCGMSAGRKWSVLRHIRKQHLGNALPVRMEEYITGVRGAGQKQQQERMVLPQIVDPIPDFVFVEKLLATPAEGVIYRRQSAAILNDEISVIHRL